MADAKNPNAFPFVTQEKAAGSNVIYTRAAPGMDLRDWLAGGVASALSSASDNSGMWMWTGPIDEAGANIIAQKAYMIADAMLAERAKAVKHG